eukprot:SAG22_NODE_27_length_29018_cov_465.809646_32_plen_518_part_00
MGVRTNAWILTAGGHGDGLVKILIPMICLWLLPPLGMGVTGNRVDGMAWREAFFNAPILIFFDHAVVSRSGQPMTNWAHNANAVYRRTTFQIFAAWAVQMQPFLAASMIPLMAMEVFMSLRFYYLCGVLSFDVAKPVTACINYSRAVTSRRTTAPAASEQSPALPSIPTGAGTVADKSRWQSDLPAQMQILPPELFGLDWTARMVDLVEPVCHRAHGTAALVAGNLEPLSQELVGRFQNVLSWFIRDVIATVDAATHTQVPPAAVERGLQIMAGLMVKSSASVEQLVEKLELLHSTVSRPVSSDSQQEDSTKPGKDGEDLAVHATLRAIALETASAQKIWEDPTGIGPQSGSKANYDSSAEVDQVDYFLSHNWGDAPNLKVSVLRSYLMTQQYVAGVGCTSVLLVIATTPVGFMLDDGGIAAAWVLPLAISCVGVCFLIWPYAAPQQWGPWKFSDKRLWLDKCCIDQTNEATKIAGIKRLGEDLQNSKHMIVFFSKDYLTRLWCIYELCWFCQVRRL